MTGAKGVEWRDREVFSNWENTVLHPDLLRVVVLNRIVSVLVIVFPLLSYIFTIVFESILHFGYSPNF